MSEPINPARLQITTTDEFLAAVPSIVGIVPSESVIVIVFDDGNDMSMSMRISTKAKRRQFEELCEVVNKQADSVILVIVEPDVDLVEDLTFMFGELLDKPIKAIFAMPVMKVGVPWVEVGTMQQGTMPDWGSTELAAMNALEGKVLYNNMGEIMKLYSPAEPAVPALAFTNVKELAQAMMDLANAVYDRELFDPSKVGGLLTHNEEWRDYVLNIIEIDAMDAHVIFANASKYLRGAARVEALTAAGVAAYLGGEGLLVATALQECFDTATLMYPKYETTLAEHVATAYHNGAHPDSIRDLVIKGDIKKVKDDLGR